MRQIVVKFDQMINRVAEPDEARLDRAQAGTVSLATSKW